MDDKELVSIIDAYRKDALGGDDGDLATQRADALDHYHGRPYGDEKQNRSQVVSKDLSETVDWAMPAIMKVFVQSGNIAEFIPESADTEDQTQEESDYVNEVIMEENDGFLVLHDAVKDSLILKNGYFKHYWHEEEKISEEEYEKLLPDEVTKIYLELQQRGEVEVKEQEETAVMTAMGEITAYNVKFQLKEKLEYCVVEAVPPEEVRVSKRCRGSLQDSYFTEHVTRKTRSELIEMGMEKEFVNSLPSYGTDDNDDQRYSRDSVSDESDDYIGVNYDRSMDEIEFCEAYVLVDYDGDGIAELRKVVTVGDNLPPGDEWNEKIDAVPMTGMVPKRVPHRHIGESLDDELEDLQRIKTVLTRSMLDNAYLNSNQEWLINERVNLNDFLKSTPGGLKRVKGKEDVSGSASPVPFTPIINQLLPAIDYIDQVKGARTGVDKTTTMIDPDILKQSTEGAISANINQASQKIEMITRLLAETGVKELVIQVQGILRRHQTKPKRAKVKNKYIEVNPSTWPQRDRARVKVGIGTGTEEERQKKLVFLSQEQMKLFNMGLVQPSHAYNLFEDQSKALGFDMPERYAMDPKSPEFQQMQRQRSKQQQPPDPLVQAEKVKGEYGMQRAQMEVEHKGQLTQIQEQNKYQIEQMKQGHKHEMDSLRDQITLQKTQMEIESKETIEAAKMELQAMIEGIKLDLGKPGIGAGLQGENTEYNYDPFTGALQPNG